MIELPTQIINILNMIKSKGYQAYLVGGFVRDSLLKRETYDVDITTNATPDIIKDIFKDYKVNEQFKKYGCIKFECDIYHIEITTYRKEYDYQNHRRPKRVEFINDLNEDLKRRDFTINALCYDGENLIDIFSGMEDLNKKCVKMIGDPMLRFEEDAIRMLRAIRFSSTLGFSIDSRILEAIDKKYYLLNKLSNSVILKELEKIEEGKHYKEVLKKYSKTINKLQKGRNTNGPII